MSAVKKAIFTLFAAGYALLLCAGFLCGFSPAAEESRYRCVWENGSVTMESEGTAVRLFAGISEEGEALVRRGDEVGRIALGEEAVHAVSVLGGTDLAAIAALGTEALSLFGRALLNLAFAGRLFYADGFFVWQNGLMPTENFEAEEIVLFGEVPASALRRMKAHMLTVTPTAQLGALAGCSFASFRAEAPYTAEGDALYLRTAGGVRLLTASSEAEELILGEYDYADRGALLASEKLSSLELPFVGNALDPSGTSADGTLAYLFSDGGSLKKIKVRGGALVSHAFYACPSVEEIDACGLSSVAADAFVDCKGLTLLHSPRGDILLNGNYAREELPCGCFLYRKIS